jgi:hypothetical protein
MAASAAHGMPAPRRCCPVSAATVYSARHTCMHAQETARGHVMSHLCVVVGLVRVRQIQNLFGELLCSQVRRQCHTVSHKVVGQPATQGARIPNMHHLCTHARSLTTVARDECSHSNARVVCVTYRCMRAALTTYLQRRRPQGKNLHAVLRCVAIKLHEHMQIVCAYTSSESMHRECAILCDPSAATVCPPSHTQ